jgi:hypothetical protein
MVEIPNMWVRIERKAETKLNSIFSGRHFLSKMSETFGSNVKAMTTGYEQFEVSQVN